MQILSRAIAFIPLLSAASGFTAEDTAMAENTLPFQTLDQGDSSGIEDPVTEVFRTKVSFEEFWGRHGATRIPHPTPPQVDFGSEMAIAVFTGMQNSGGYSVAITSIDQKEDGIIVNFLTKSPPPGSINTMALTQPYHIVSVTAPSDSKVLFEGSQEAPPAPAFPRFIITFKQGSDMDAVVEKIEAYPTIKNVQLLRSVKIAFVDFDPDNTDKGEARQFLQDVEGVNSIEEETPM